LNKISEQKKRLIERITKSTDENLTLVYEKSLAELNEKEMVLNDLLESVERHTPRFETSLEIVFDFLQNPLKQWRTGDIETRKLLLNLVFQKKLTYNRKGGFETAILSLPLRVFTLPEAQNSVLVVLF